MPTCIVCARVYSHLNSCPVPKLQALVPELINEYGITHIIEMFATLLPTAAKEWLPLPRTHPMPSGLERIASERNRQRFLLGYTVQHDAAHTKSQLAKAAIAYAYYAVQQTNEPEMSKLVAGIYWPKEWTAEQFKPDAFNRIHNLTRAGALIAAEIDRLLHQGEDY